jgi:hypothetical protein
LCCQLLLSLLLQVEQRLLLRPARWLCLPLRLHLLGPHGNANPPHTYPD